MTDDKPDGWYCSVTQDGDPPVSWLWGPFATRQQAEKKLDEADGLGDDSHVWQQQSGDKSVL